MKSNIFSRKYNNGGKKCGINLFGFTKKYSAGLFNAASRALDRVKLSGEINIILVPDAEIKRLNRKFRKVNRITDVISFLTLSEFLYINGDIFIAKRRSMLQAKAQGHAWDRELSYLVIHGILHLKGYTDYTGPERAKMFTLQDKIWAYLY